MRERNGNEGDGKKGEEDGVVNRAIEKERRECGR